MTIKTSTTVFATLIALGGCGTSTPQGASKSGGTLFAPNCDPGDRTCLIQLKVVDGWFGSRRFYIDPEDAVTPDNSSQSVRVTWLIRSPDYRFDINSQDGVDLGNNVNFDDRGYALGGAAYQWTLRKGNTAVKQKYSLTFHEVGGNGPGRKWVCDPTIHNFNGSGEGRTGYLAGWVDITASCR